MQSPDERVALLAAQALLDRGYGKPREYLDLPPVGASRAEERRRAIVATLIANLEAEAATKAAGVGADRLARNGAVQPSTAAPKILVNH